MSEWISYDEFVDRVRSHHHDGFTGLVTGVSEQNHAFKIGFDAGRIVLITYRIRKGQPALDLLSQISQAKLTEYPGGEAQYSAGEMPETALIMSQLTGNTLDDTAVTVIEEVPELRPSADSYSENIDAVIRKNIEAAAVHHFGPIGALVCDELLQNYRGDLRNAVFQIAQEVGASEADTRAFFESIATD